MNLEQKSKVFKFLTPFTVNTFDFCSRFKLLPYIYSGTNQNRTLPTDYFLTLPPLPKQSATAPSPYSIVPLYFTPTSPTQSHDTAAAGIARLMSSPLPTCPSVLGVCCSIDCGPDQRRSPAAIPQGSSVTSAMCDLEVEMMRPARRDRVRSWSRAGSDRSGAGALTWTASWTPVLVGGCWCARRRAAPGMR